MSLATEVEELFTNKAAIKAAIEAQNPSTPPGDVMSNWPASIASIRGGGGTSDPSYEIYSPPATTVTIDNVEYTQYQLKNRAINNITLSNSFTGKARIVYPQNIASSGGTPMSRDFFVRLIIEADEAPDVTFAAYTGESSPTIEGGADVLAVEPGCNLIMFSEVVK